MVGKWHHVTCLESQRNPFKSSSRDMKITHTSTLWHTISSKRPIENASKAHVHRLCRWFPNPDTRTEYLPYPYLEKYLSAFGWNWMKYYDDARMATLAPKTCKAHASEKMRRSSQGHRNSNLELKARALLTRKTLWWNWQSAAIFRHTLCAIRWGLRLTRIGPIGDSGVLAPTLKSWICCSLQALSAIVSYGVYAISRLKGRETCRIPRSGWRPITVFQPNILAPCGCFAPFTIRIEVEKKARDEMTDEEDEEGWTNRAKRQSVESLSFPSHWCRSLKQALNLTFTLVFTLSIVDRSMAFLTLKLQRGDLYEKWSSFEKQILKEKRIFVGNRLTTAEEHWILVFIP